jgi:hypothetical protein
MAGAFWDNAFLKPTIGGLPANRMPCFEECVATMRPYDDDGVRSSMYKDLPVYERRKYEEAWSKGHPRYTGQTRRTLPTVPADFWEEHFDASKLKAYKASVQVGWSDTEQRLAGRCLEFCVDDKFATGSEFWADTVSTLTPANIKLQTPAERMRYFRTDSLPENKAKCRIHPSSVKPEDLLGRWINVTGKGRGRVVAYHPGRWSKHKHTVDFVNGGEQKVLLRRRKGAGLAYHLCLSPPQKEAALWARGGTRRSLGA